MLISDMNGGGVVSTAGTTTRSSESSVAATVRLVSQLIRQRLPHRDRRFASAWRRETHFLTRVRDLLVQYDRAAVGGGGSFTSALRGGMAAPAAASGSATQGRGIPESMRARHGPTIVSAGAPTGADGGKRAAVSVEASRRFMALQKAVQTESRRFLTLSLAARARHDIAVKAVNNTRA